MDFGTFLEECSMSNFLPLFARSDKLLLFPFNFNWQGIEEEFSPVFFCFLQTKCIKNCKFGYWPCYIAYFLIALHNHFIQCNQAWHGSKNERRRSCRITCNLNRPKWLNWYMRKNFSICMIISDQALWDEELNSDVVTNASEPLMYLFLQKYPKKVELVSLRPCNE